jgi:hypothetical protein
MLQEIFKVIINILKLNKNFFKDKKNFGKASIYFAILLVLIGSIISIIPNSSFLVYMGSNLDLGIIQGPSLRIVIISSLIMWFIKKKYLFFAGTILFPDKKTNCDYRKILILVAYCQVPLFLNVLVLTPSLLILIFITYIWYNVSLIIGLKILFNYESYMKTTLVSLAPQIIFLIYIMSVFQNNNITFS